MMPCWSRAHADVGCVDEAVHDVGGGVHAAQQGAVGSSASIFIGASRGARAEVVDEALEAPHGLLIRILGQAREAGLDLSEGLGCQTAAAAGVEMGGDPHGVIRTDAPSR